MCHLNEACHRILASSSFR